MLLGLDFEFVLRSGFSIFFYLVFEFWDWFSVVFFILKLRIVFLLEFKFKFRQMLVHSI